MVERIALGAPGVYRLPSSPPRAIGGVPMDVCAFVGVAPRGPARVPFVGERWRGDVPTVEPERPRLRSVAVAVESWTDYQRLYGAFEGPGRLPYAVSTFFDQGGRRAYVVRIVHEYGDAALNAAGVGRAELAGLVRRGGGAVGFVARNEGAWGNFLSATLELRAEPLDLEPGGSDLALVIRPEVELPLGTLLRLRLGGGQRVLRFVVDVRDVGRVDTPRRSRYASYDTALSEPAVAAEVVEGRLVVDDGAGRREVHDALGLGSDHPRFLATVLSLESELLFPDAAWIADDLFPSGPELRPASAGDFEGGEDRYPAIETGDFFGDATEELPGSGVRCLTEVEDVASVCVPDLYEPAPVPDVEPVVVPSVAGPEFHVCVDHPPAADVQAEPVLPLFKLMLDPQGSFDDIVALQQQLVAAAEEMGLVAFLDVPPGLRQSQILRWRAAFDSSYAAGYHPWLLATRLGLPTPSPVLVNPSAVAAGIVAKRERLFGIPFGPANEVAAGVVDVADRVSGPRHDELHQGAINVFLRERDGVRLTAARTLSRDRDYRQLSVRRLVTMIERTLARELQWLVFEPHTPTLRADLSHQLVVFLRGLFRANAFVGASEREAFFVRCDEVLNPPVVVEAGRLVCEIGIAPAEPIEFVVLRIERDGDGTLRIEGARG